jgi:3-dehydroquinate dehydratase-1
MAMLEPLLDLATLVDIEVANAPEMSPIMHKARQRGVLLVGSFHDFTSTPSAQTLQAVACRAGEQGFDILKVATTLRDARDLAQLISFCGSLGDLPRSIMGMGELGRVSRLALAKVGSLLNYGYLGQANAPGQWPAARLKELLNAL